MGVDADKKMRDDILRASIPQGYRPASCESIDRLLETVSADPFTEEKIDRILGKLAGDIPFRQPADARTSAQPDAEVGELIALHRAKGAALSPEMQKKIDAIKAQISKSDKSVEQ